MKIAKKLKTYSSHRWFGVYAGGVISLDYFIPVLPSTTLVIASSLLQPKKWLTMAIWLALGSTIGGVFVSSLLQVFSEVLINGIFSGVAASDEWHNMITFIQRYGVYGLFLFACIPTPIRTVTFVTAISGVSLPMIAIAILGGRLVSYVGLSYITSRFPNWLLKISFLRRSPFLLEVLEENNKSSIKVGKNHLTEDRL